MPGTNYCISHHAGIGNPRGNENPFLLTMGILWFRVHNWWAKQLREYGKSLGEDAPEVYHEDEWLYNRARQLTIATHQRIVYNEWLPQFIPRAMPENGTLPPYKKTQGYSLYFGNSGYNPSINPQVAHIFQSAAMRFGHTIVTPGIWRRERVANQSTTCRFGSPMSFEGENTFLERLRDRDPNELGFELPVATWRELIDRFVYNDNNLPSSPESEEIRSFINESLNVDRNNRNIDDPTYTYQQADNRYFGVRTCNSFWNPQVTIEVTNVDPFYLGMASQRTEREDTIITPDLRGKVE